MKNRKYFSLLFRMIAMDIIYKSHTHPQPPTNPACQMKKANTHVVWHRTDLQEHYSRRYECRIEYINWAVNPCRTSKY